jgi:CBS domain-containing protein
MKVKQIMHAGAETLAPNDTVFAISKTMRDKDIGAAPIADKGALVGMVTDRDIALRALGEGRDAGKLTAKDIMTGNVISCRDTDDVKDVAKLMEAHRVRRLPVLDRDKKIVGMISLGDLSHAAPHALTEDVVKAVSAHHA